MRLVLVVRSASQCPVNVCVEYFRTFPHERFVPLMREIDWNTNSTFHSTSTSIVFNRFQPSTSLQNSPTSRSVSSGGRGYGVRAWLYSVSVIYPKMQSGSTLKLKSNVVDLAISVPPIAPPFICDSTCGTQSSRRF